MDNILHNWYIKENLRNLRNLRNLSLRLSSDNSDSELYLEHGVKITFDDLIDKILSKREISGWFSSNGEIYEVNSTSHKAFIYTKFRKEIDQLRKEKDFIAIYDFAYEKGWTRFFCINANFSIDCTWGLSKIYDKIKNIEEVTGNKVDVHIAKYLETYGFSNNWYKVALKTMPKEKKEKKMGNEVAINEIGVENHISGWLSPNGTFYKVPVWQHKAFISKVFGNIVKMLSESDLYQFAYLKNWLRIVSYGSGGVFGGTHLEGILEVQGTQEGIYHNKHTIEQIKDATGNIRIEYKVER